MVRRQELATFDTSSFFENHLEFANSIRSILGGGESLQELSSAAELYGWLKEEKEHFERFLATPANPFVEATGDKQRSIRNFEVVFYYALDIEDYGLMSLFLCYEKSLPIPFWVPVHGKKALADFFYYLDPEPSRADKAFESIVYFVGKDSLRRPESPGNMLEGLIVSAATMRAMRRLTSSADAQLLHIFAIGLLGQFQVAFDRLPLPDRLMTFAVA